ncbi:MAG: hypothetical protein ACJ77G_16760 [Solirubrobacteraceae bacterium]
MSPTRSRRLTRAAAGALAVTALAAPAASARPVDAPVGWKLTTPAQTHSQPAAPAPTVIRSTDDSFDWGAAGIGAGAGAVIVLLSLGGVRARRHGTVGA